MDDFKYIDDYINWLMYLLAKWDLAVLQAIGVWIAGLWIGEEVICKYAGPLTLRFLKNLGAIFKGGE
jgi:hypothetical protein